MGTFFSIVFTVISLLLWLAANKQHRDATGFNLPSANARKRIRRNARRKGISEVQAHAEWVVNKRARLPKGSYIPAPRAPSAARQPPLPSVTPPAVTPISGDTPERDFHVSSPVQAQMSYKGHSYNLHSDYTITAILNGDQFRWKSLHSFRRWVDAGSTVDAAFPETPPAATPLVVPTAASEEFAPQEQPHDWLLIGSIAFVILVGAGVWVSISRHPQTGDPSASRHLPAEVAQVDPGMPPVIAQPVQAPEPPKTTSSRREMISTRRSGNIRELPEKNAPISKTARAGMSFYVYDRQRDWVKVGVEKPWGWMHSSLLTPASP